MTRHETDYLVEIDGDLAAPRLEVGKHDAWDWAGRGNLDALLAGRTDAGRADAARTDAARTDAERGLRDVVARAVRTRRTARLLLSPLGPWHAGDLWRLHYDEAVATWHAGRYTVAMAEAAAVQAARGWERDGAHKWMAFDRADGSLVGRGGVSLAYVDGQERFEVGWTVRGGLWGRGYATEIGAAGLAYAFGDLGGGGSGGVHGAGQSPLPITR